MIRAAAWLIGGNISSQVLRLASNLVLTRLLVPEAFGLMAAVNTLYFALVMFSDLGIWQSVVRSDRGHSPRFLGTAWSVQLLRGILLAGVVVAIALLIHWGGQAGLFHEGTVYADTRLPPMVGVFALCALIQGLESMNIATAQRELHGGYLARMELISQVGAMAVTLPLAWVTKSVWALLIGTLMYSALRTLLSHFYLPGRVTRPCWDRACAYEIIHFGKWVFVSSITGFLAANGEKIILGGQLTTGNFGIFSIAATLLAAIVGIYSTLNGHVIFPSMSVASRSEDPDQLIRVYTKIQKLVDMFLGVLAGGLLMTGHWVVWFLYDARYHDAGWMLQWLSVGLLAMRHQVVEQLMFLQGKPAWVSGGNALRAFSLVVLIPLGFRVCGEAGAIIGVVVSQFTSWPLSLRFKQIQGLLGWSTEQWWLPSLCVGAAGGWLLDMSIHAVLNL